jgi:WD40 repeat protein
VLSASWDQTLKIWDATSGDRLFTLTGHSAPVWSCAWSPDGRRALSASLDGSVRIYDTQTGMECGPQCWHVKSPRGEPSWASVDPKTNAVLNYGEEAWRSVGYVVPDDDGMPTWLPVEAVESPQM